MFFNCLLTWNMFSLQTSLDTNMDATHLTPVPAIKVRVGLIVLLSRCFPGSTEVQSWLIAILTCFPSLNVACCFSKLQTTEWRWHWWTGLGIEQEVSRKENKSLCCYLTASAKKSRRMEWCTQSIFIINAQLASAASAKEGGDWVKSSVGILRKSGFPYCPAHRGTRSASSCYQWRKSNCTWYGT